MSFLAKGNARANNKIYGIRPLLKGQCALGGLIQISLQCASVGTVIPAYLCIILHHDSSTDVT